VLAATAGASTVCIFPPFLLGAMAVQVRDDLGFSVSGTGLAVGAFFLVASLLSAPLGRWSERVGGARALRVAALWAATGLLLLAVAAESLVLLVVLNAFAGGANALGQPAANLLIARAVPSNRQGLGFAVKQAAIPFSTFLAGLAVPSIALTAGWRWAYVSAAGVALVAAVAIPVNGRAGRSSAPLPADTTGGAGGRLPFRVMAVLATGVALGAATAATLGAFFVTAGVEAGLSEGTAALTLTLGSALVVTVRLTAGVLADRRGGGHLRQVTVMLAVGAFGYLLFAVGRPGLMLVGVPLAFGAGWAWPGLFNLAVVMANPASPGAATGITQTGTYMGAVIGPLLFGFLAEHVSFGWSWVVAALTSWAAAAAMWTGRAMLRRTRAEVASPSVA
jgi:MFS family permease